MEMLGYTLYGLGFLASMACFILVVYLAFQESGPLWAILCFIPCGILIVVIKHWETMKVPFLIMVGSSLTQVLGLALLGQLVGDARP